MTGSLAVWGTTSGAGKSLLTTGLARWFRRQGVRVVPFKAQNMSHHARVIAGGEIGVAQWLQALAAGVEPDVRMNPVLTKPEADDRSQVIVLGQVDEALSRRAWRGRAASLWPVARDALDDLRAGADLVLVEGAGSPAETNLADVDLANLATAAHLDARALLVTDVDRGGAFAHLHGTWALLPEEHRDRLGGFVLNRFRGDVALLDPAPADLERRTGVPTLGVVPELTHRLPEEDGAGSRRQEHGERSRVAVSGDLSASDLDALGDRTRQAIIARLARGDATVGELAEPFALTHQAVSRHVGILRRCGLIQQRVDGQRRPCRLDVRRMQELSGWITAQQREWESRLDRLEEHVASLPPQDRRR